MKKIFAILTILLISSNLSIAQSVEPTFEKENDLVKATYFYDNGMVKEVGFFKEDKLHDKWVSYDQEGKISIVAQYENGLKDGQWFIVEEDHVKQLTYQDNKLIKVEEPEGTEISFL